ncbi:GAF domain-containing protein [Cronbergia sp. UHCC 0137]|uniref:GAF domain-containing sensor histidine kinase n=1 Tax=Cronbergia sp. UHCC 0137 TaxID=3110239 RepID=UPI002B212363|nr:GAF domain-containing protein [Cronbergia sp. UHCC 0137]MEA5620201.1 GAF domain-containing protein [Cronbergia sp. UHCC 0137]
MNRNPVKSISKLSKLSTPQMFLGTDVDKKNSSEQFLLSMYDSVQTSIFIVDVLEDGDFRYLGLNPTHERWIGIRSEEVRGKKPEDILSPVDAARVRQHYVDCVRFGKTISYEQCLQFQGISTWWSTTLTPLRDAKAKIYRLIGTSSNITQSKQTGRMQAERERILESIGQKIRQFQPLETIFQQTVKEIRQLLDCDRVLIYHFNIHQIGEIIAESTIMVGNSLLGQKINDPCFHVQHLERYKRGCIQIIEDIHTAGLHPCQRDFLASIQVKANLVLPILLQQDLWGLLIVQHCRETRQWQQIEINLLQQIASQLSIAIQQQELHQQIKNLQLQQQQLPKFLAFIKQITEQIRDHLDAEKILQNTVKELVQLLTLERCQIELYDQLQITAVVTCEYTNHPPHCQGLTRHLADFPEIYQPLLQKQPLASVEILSGWNPQLQLVNQLACPIFHSQGVLGNIWLIRSTDQPFTELEISLIQEVANQCAIAIRQSQLSLTNQIQLQELKNQERYKNEFLKTLAQQLRTPITSISLAGQTLESLLTPNGILDIELVPQLLQILHQECGRESKLINDLLTLAYLKIEPEPPTLIAIDLKTWLTPIVESFRDVTDCQKQQLNLNIHENLPPLETDITDFERIITELLNHACKCTPPSELITVSANLNIDTVELKITHSGVEVPVNQPSLIFQPFYRLAKHDSWKSSETGLELALVKTMINRLNGSICVHSMKNQIIFTIKFPYTCKTSI